MLDCSIWSQYFSTLSPKETVTKFLEGGFNCTELSDEDGTYLLEHGPAAITEFRRFADENGFRFPQGHLLLRVDLCSDNAVDVLKEWLDMFLELGIRSSVLHASGGNGLTEDQRFSKHIKALDALCDYIKGTDMTICLENLIRTTNPRTSSDLLKYIDTVKSEHLGICLDTGHLNATRALTGVTETQREFILNAGKHLKALHIHDNDGSGDQHLLPYSRGTIDWCDFMSALKESGYNRLFNFEIPGESAGAPLEMQVEKLKYIKKVSEYMTKGLA